MILMTLATDMKVALRPQGIPGTRDSKAVGTRDLKPVNPRPPLSPLPGRRCERSHRARSRAGPGRAGEIAEGRVRTASL
jgi:hypothetical protein